MKTPPRPTGFNGEAIFAQAVWDELFLRQRPLNSMNVLTGKTTRGSYRTIVTTLKIPPPER